MSCCPFADALFFHLVEREGLLDSESLLGTGVLAYLRSGQRKRGTTCVHTVNVFFTETRPAQRLKISRPS